jgi:hypothetical protein
MMQLVHKHLHDWRFVAQLEAVDIFDMPWLCKLVDGQRCYMSRLTCLSRALFDVGQFYFERRR